MKKFILFIFTTVSLLAFGQQAGVGVFSSQFIPFSARSAALAGSSIALQDNDPGLILQNPSLLNANYHHRTSLSFLNYLADAGAQQMMYAHHWEKTGSFAFSLQRFHYGKMEGRDELMNPTGNFSASDNSLNVSFARPLDSSFSYGFTFRNMFSQAVGFTSFAQSIDGAFLYVHRASQSSLTLLVKNMGIQWTSYNMSTREKLVPDFQIGYTKRIAKAPFRINIAFGNLFRYKLSYTSSVTESIVNKDFGDGKEKKEKSNFGTSTRQFFDELGRHTLLGAEILLSKNFQLRLGYDYRKRKEMILPESRGLSGISFGFNFTVKKVQFYYAYTRFHPASNSHFFTFNMNLSDFIKKAS